MTQPGNTTGCLTPEAQRLIEALRRLMDGLPGVTSMDFFEGRSWSWLSLGAVTDEAVRRTGAELGLGAPQERRITGEDGARRWYLYAGSKHVDRGVIVEIDIAGPHHIEPPRKGGAP